MCCHAPYEVPNFNFLTPIQVGTALSGEEFDGFVHDNTGEHISDKNKSYCELTAHYWVWKNNVSDFVGFFHYRRYLYPDLRTKSVYQIVKQPDMRTLQGLQFPTLSDVISDYDIVLPKGENMWVSVEEHYKNAPFHHAKDLDLMKEVLCALKPEYQNAMERYLSQTFSYFGNMFGMKRALFEQYCEFVFPILEQCEKNIDFEGRTTQETRVLGYLGERLLGVFYFHHRENVKSLELPRVQFEPDFKVRMRKKILNAVLPPSSKRRYVVKSWRKG